MPLHGEPLDRCAPAKPLRGTRTRQKARRKRETAKARKACREAVKARAHQCCEMCGCAVRDDLPEWHPDRAHVHEIVARSLGGSAIDPANCLLLCQLCHRTVHKLGKRP